MIRQCDSCGKKPHTQDELHGKGMRVFNELKTKDGLRTAHCTVCGREHQLPREDSK